MQSRTEGTSSKAIQPTLRMALCSIQTLFNGYAAHPGLERFERRGNLSFPSRLVVMVNIVKSRQVS